MFGASGTCPAARSRNVRTLLYDEHEWHAEAAQGVDRAVPSTFPRNTDYNRVKASAYPRTGPGARTDRAHAQARTARPAARVKHPFIFIEIEGRAPVGGAMTQLVIESKMAVKIEGGGLRQAWVDVPQIYARATVMQTICGHTVLPVLEHKSV